MSDDDLEDPMDPADAFALLGEETRVSILRALAERSRDFRPDPVPFSELHDAVGLRDSAQFNYHLQQLVGHFLEKTDDGYRLRYAGRKVVRALRAGVYTERPTFGPEPVAGSCVWCGAEDLVATADGEWIAVTCRACGEDLTANQFPPGGLEDRDPDAVMAAFDRLVRHRVAFAADGICPECTGRMDGHVSTTIPEPWNFGALPAYRCRRCDFWVVPSFGMLILDHPRTVEAYATGGIDLRDRPYWDLPLCVSDRYTTVESRDPWSVRLEVPFDEFVLRAEVDADLGVTGPRLEEA